MSEGGGVTSLIIMMMTILFSTFLPLLRLYTHTMIGLTIVLTSRLQARTPAAAASARGKNFKQILFRAIQMKTNEMMLNIREDNVGTEPSSLGTGRDYYL